VARFDRAILPGKEGYITLKLNTKGYQGAIKKSALVYSNDPEKPSVRLAISTNVKVPISIQPRGVFIEGFKGDDIQSVVIIKSHEDKPLELSAISNSLPKKVAYELKAIKAGKIYHLILKNISKGEDKYSGFISLKTNYFEKPELTVRFLGFIKSRSSSDPKRSDLEVNTGT
jgi:hypothetical protein